MYRKTQSMQVRNSCFVHKKAEIEDLHEGPVCRYAISVAKREFLHFKK